MQIEAVIFDMDDTLLTGEREITPYTLQVLRALAARGVRVIPASGRTKNSLWPYVEKIGCAAAVICANGAELRLPTGELLFRATLPVETGRDVVRYLSQRDVYYQSYDETGYFYSIAGQWAENYAAQSGLPGRLVTDVLAEMDVPRTKVLCMADPERVAVLLKEARALFGDRVQVTSSMPWFLEFNAPEATKGGTLRKAADALGFRVENTVAFGDGLNDVSMLQAAGRGVAMGNARDEVKMQADDVCGSNTEDGVARYLAALAGLTEDQL